MIKKTITYELFDGEKVTEDFYFNLTKTEILQWRFSVSGGIEKRLEDVINRRDETAMMSLLVDLIDMSYGEKSVDGKRFEKKRNGIPLIEGFKQTNAYDILFMELSSDTDKFTEFLTGIIPADMAQELTNSKTLPVGPATLKDAAAN